MVSCVVLFLSCVCVCDLFLFVQLAWLSPAFTLTLLQGVSGLPLVM